jgi:hypothetical protein
MIENVPVAGSSPDGSVRACPERSRGAHAIEPTIVTTSESLVRRRNGKGDMVIVQMAESRELKMADGRRQSVEGRGTGPTVFSPLSRLPSAICQLRFSALCHLQFSTA